jgi:hydroxyacylglutathione hydrolase
VGYEKRTSPLLQKKREEFVRYKVHEHHYLPPYFHRMEELNTRGPPPMLQVPVLTPLSVQEVHSYQEKDAQIVDIRAPTSFGGGYLEGSVNIWRGGVPFFIGWMLNYEDPVILIDDFNVALDPITRMFIREGYDNVMGYLDGGFPAWSKAGMDVGIIPQWTPVMLQEQMKEKPFILDVRDIEDRKTVGHIPTSYHRYIGELPGHLDEIPRDRLIVTYCDAGFKGNMAASILVKEGYPQVVNLTGGIGGWKNSGLPLEK